MPAPCYVDTVMQRTHAILDAFAQQEDAAAQRFYEMVIVPRIEAHLAALPRMLASGALTPGLAFSTVVDWPNNATYNSAMREKVCALLKEHWFECSEAMNAAQDLFIHWGL